MARLWDLTDNTTAYEIVVGERSEFQHRFGGEPRYSGINPANGERPVHLLFTFDLSDPKVPFRKPACAELPLLYPFQYDGSSLAYRLIDNDRIEIVQQPKCSFTPDFPFAGYPAHFPLRWVKLSMPIRLEIYFEDEFLQECLHEEEESASSKNHRLDDTDRIAIVEGLMQGPPRTVCSSPECNEQPMTLLTILRGDTIDGLHFWSDEASGPEVDITYEFCPKCYLIYTENQCD